MTVNGPQCEEIKHHPPPCPSQDTVVMYVYKTADHTRPIGIDGMSQDSNTKMSHKTQLASDAETKNNSSAMMEGTGKLHCHGRLYLVLQIQGDTTNIIYSSV
jgi:hypothetical protein